MENQKNILVIKKRKRTRKRHNSQLKPGTLSCISARLHPDFDPAKKVTQALFAEPIHEETNSNTASFEELVEFLNPTLIYEYLDKILKFLNSPKKLISFPNIAPLNAAFLVRIAKNNENLKSEALDEKNQQLASEILEVVEKNKNVFEWVHTYEDGNFFKIVLVYKKQFFNETAKDKKADSSKLPLNTRLTSTLESMKFSNETKDNVQSNFKVTFLNTTLRFLKDDNQLILEYPQMSLVEGQYAYSLLQYRDQNGSLEFGFHTMNASLHFAMRELEDKYDFKVSFKNTTISFGTTKIVLEKVPKLVKEIKNKSAELNTSNATTSVVDSLKLPDNPDMIKLLPESFVRATLEKAAEFFHDNCIASADFKQLITVQSRFVKSLPEICQQEHLYELFSPDCRKLLSRISMAVKHNWKLKVNVGKACAVSKTRTITYFKEPVFAKLKSLQSIVVKIDNTPLGQTKPKEPLTAKKTYGKRAADRIIKINNGKVENLKVVIKNNDSIGNTTTKKYIEFQSAGLQTIDTTGISDVPTIGKTASDVINALSIKRRSVLAGLATPLESDRAERMMRVMGWDGGALGVRGDGITEPVVPALHIKPGAGLGHVKKAPEQQSQGDQSTSAADLRIAFLNKILRFITGLNSCEEKSLISRITNFMAGNPTLLIIFQIKEDTQEIYFAKETIPASNDPTIKTRKKSKTVKNVVDIKNDVKTHTENGNDSVVKNDPEVVKNNSEVVINNSEVVKNVIKTGVKNDTTTLISTITVLELAGELENERTNLKTAKNIAFRVLFMEKMREFLAQNKDLLEIKLDSHLSQKNRRYIENVLLEFNRRRRVVKGHQLENDVYNEIHDIGGDCFMRFVFNEQQIVLHKKYYKKYATNSALEPPKSKD